MPWPWSEPASWHLIKHKAQRVPAQALQTASPPLIIGKNSGGGSFFALPWQYNERPAGRHERHQGYEKSKAEQEQYDSTRGLFHTR